MHAERFGETSLCEHYMLMQRMIIEGQAKLIADLQRRLNGEPVTQVFLEAVR